MEAITAQLDYFSPHVYQVAIEGTEMVPIRPTSTPVGGGPVEFLIPRAPLVVLDLTQTMLQVRCKITKADGTNADANTPCVVNNFAHSMWRSIDVEFNGKRVTDANNLYAYRAYFEDLLSFPNELQETQMQMQGWYKDTAGEMDTITHNGNNLGARKRIAMVVASREFELWMHPHADPFSMQKALPMNVDMKVIFTPSRNLFHTKHANEHKLNILEAVLWVKRVKLTQSFALALIAEQQKRNLHVQLGHNTMKILSIPTGQSAIVHDQVYTGQLPKKILVALVPEATVQGAAILNPFNFGHNNVKYFCASVNGELVPARPYEPDFAGGRYIRELFALYQNCDVLYTDKTVAINRDEFVTGFCFWVLDLSRDAGCGSGGFTSAPTIGNVSLEIKFTGAIAATLNIICYAIYDAFLEFDKYNNILASFN